LTGDSSVGLFLYKEAKYSMAMYHPETGGNTCQPGASKNKKDFIGGCNEKEKS